MTQNKIEISLAELERTEQNKKILLQYIAEFPARPVEIERICDWPERTYSNIVTGKRALSEQNLIKSVKNLRIFSENDKKSSRHVNY